MTPISASASKKQESARPLVTATMQSARTMTGVTTERGEGVISLKSLSSILIIVSNSGTVIYQSQ